MRSKLRTPVPKLRLLTEHVRKVHVAVDGQFSTSKLAAGDNGEQLANMAAAAERRRKHCAFGLRVINFSLAGSKTIVKLASELH